MTRFQLEMEAQLIEALRPLGCNLENRRLLGHQETFIQAALGRTGIEVFIYVNEAQFQGPGVDCRFELQDYPNQSLLRDAFIAQAVSFASAT